MLKINETEDSYEYGKKLIFLLTFSFTSIGITVDMVLFHEHSTSWLLVSACLALILLIVTLILYLRNQSKIHFYYGLLSWIIIINIFAGQLLFPETAFNLNMFEDFILRDLIFLMSVIILNGFISSRINLIAQASLLFIFLFYYALFEADKVPFLTSNIHILTIVIVGFLMSVLFFTKHLNSFLYKLKRQQIDLEKKNQELLNTLENAKVIQDYILTDKDKIEACFPQSFICFEPKHIVSGDFYWVENYGSKKIFAVADCTGHGVSGALTSMTCHQALTKAVDELGLRSTGEMLDKTREFVLQKFRNKSHSVSDGMDIALCSIEGNILEYSGANIPLWIVKKGYLKEYKATKQPIGIFVTNTKYKTHRIELEEGDRIYIASDGFADQFGGESGKKMKTRYFKNLIENMQNKKIINQGTYLTNTLKKWRGSYEQIDDVCVLGINFEYDK